MSELCEYTLTVWKNLNLILQLFVYGRIKSTEREVYRYVKGISRFIIGYSESIGIFKSKKSREDFIT